MKILVVSPYFPPSPSVAVVRISSLIRYLLKKNCEIKVLTNKVDEEPVNRDRENTLNKLKKFKVDIKNNNGKYFKNKESYVKKFREIMDSEKFDLVLITAGPFYTLPLCEISKKEYNTNCIIDFRDLWIFDVRNLNAFLKPKNLLKKACFYPIEYKAIKYAEKVVTVTDGWGNTLKKIYPKYKNKIEVVYNGFDREYLETQSLDKFRNNEIPVIDENYNIMVFGKLAYYSKRYASIFLKAVKELSKKNKDIKIIQIGTHEELTADLIKKLNLPDIYLNTGFLNYGEGISILEKSSVNVIIDIRKNAIGTKVYDYVYINKPIIYVGKRNTYLSKFVTSFKYGFSCSNEEEIKKTINYLLENNINELTTTKTSNTYSREYQNERFYRLISKTR